MRRACEGWASCHPRIALCAIALHVVVHSIMLVALVARGDFVGRKPRSKRKEAPPRGGAFSRMPFAIGGRSLAMAPPRLIGGIIWCGEVASARHARREGSFASCGSDLDRCAHCGERRSRRAGMRCAEVARLRKTASRYPCSLLGDPNGQRRLSSFPVFSRRAHPSASSIEAGLTEGRSRFAGSRSCPRNVRPRLSSPGAARHSSRFKKLAPGRPPLRFGPSGAGRSPPVSRPPSRSR